MLIFTDAQWQQLQVKEGQQFVTAVAEQFLTNRPDMNEHPGREAIVERMQAAHSYALRIGFMSTQHIVRLMYLAADAPMIHDDPRVDYQLRKPGASPEQRFDDLTAVMNKKLEGAF